MSRRRDKQPLFTRKHYDAAARTVNFSREIQGANLVTVVGFLTFMFERDNPAFDRARFWKDCDFPRKDDE